MVIKRTSHAVYDTKYHLVWAPKYRKWIVREDIRQRARDVSPLSQEGVELPGGSPEKVQDEVIVVETQEEPTDNTGDAKMIAANEQAEEARVQVV